MRKAVIILLAVAVVCMGAAAILWFSIAWTDEGSDVYAGGVVLRTSAGRIMRVTLGPGDTDCRPYYKVNPNDWIVKAIVAAEDGTFWEHHGVRPMSVVRAVFQNVLHRRRVSGASTLSMQTVRLLSPHAKSFTEKICEAVRAVKMEREKDKCWILSQYLNRAPFGSNLVGVEAAAQGWFGKSANELTLGEAACLAGMVQAPSHYRPDRHFDRCMQRRAYVLDRMVTLGMITDKERIAVQAVPPTVCRAPRPFDYPFYCDWVLTRQSRTTEVSPVRADITTDLDEDVQHLCEEVVAGAEDEGGYSSAAIVMRVKDGAVLALACSGNYFAHENGQVNTALSPRPAGSTLKPFLTALAFDRGLATPEERVADVPVVYNGYRPTNFDNKYRGRVTVREALIQSLNVPFVQLLQRVGVSEFSQTLASLGFSHITDTDAAYGLGMAIGNVPVNLMELVSGYATLARGGGQVFSEGSSYLVSDILSGDERSLAALGHIADVEVSRFAWKTGTSSAYRDAWTIAWNPDYVIGVWCGHKYGGFGDTTLVGARASAPRCWRIARNLYPGQTGPWFTEPSSVIRRTICSHSGMAAGTDCVSTEVGHAITGHSLNITCTSCHWSNRERLTISRPENQSVFCLVEGMAHQRIVSRVIGITPREHLWWFVDGKPQGESMGLEPHTLELSDGPHDISCVADNGESSSVTITIERK